MLARPEFLSAAECVSLCEQMDAAPRAAGGVRDPERPDADAVEAGDRQAGECLVAERTREAVAARVLTLVPELEATFRVRLGEYEAPHFVVYEPGDFYRPHRDRYPDVALPEPLARRRVAVVVLLNDGDGTEFGGGVLRVGAPDGAGLDPAAAESVVAAAGLAVAFPAEAWHEVTPVWWGRRYSVVLLLLAPPG